MIVKRYVDAGFGQVHVRENSRVAGRTLACLHATAYSSRSFAALLDALDGRRHAVALDTPGYGASDPPPQQVDIAGYADALAQALDGEQEPVDLLGYHTGAYLAAEMALRHPRRIGRLILVGIPFFQALGFDEWRARLTARHALGGELSQFAERWEFLVESRPVGVSLERAFENFIDELAAWPNGWWAHEALFDYPAEDRLPRIAQPVLVLNPAGHLAAPSRAAAALMRNVTLVELPELAGAVFDGHPALMAEHIERFLGKRVSC